MSLFLFLGDYQALLATQYHAIIPILPLVRKGYYSYMAINLILEQEKDKIYRFFHEKCANSKKKIRRLTINDQSQADVLLDRCKIYPKISYHEQIYEFESISPTIELIEWPADTMLSGYTFNQLTKGRYISTDESRLIGTYIIPIVDTTATTNICKLGEDDLGVADVCICANSCCCMTKKCKCKSECCCNTYSAAITGKNSLFYLSDLEPREVFYKYPRLYMYVHINYVRP